MSDRVFIVVVVVGAALVGAGWLYVAWNLVRVSRAWRREDDRGQS